MQISSPDSAAPNGDPRLHAYMLRCSDGSYYVGSSRDSLDRRIVEHNAGSFPGYTSRRRPVELVWHEEFQRITDAIAVERQLKGWSRAKKEALIRRDYDALRRLSQSRAKTGQAG
jgi:putative endonuclease